MARHLTWCLRRTLQYTNTLSMYKPCTLLRSINSSPNLLYRTATKNDIIIPKFPQIMEDSADYEDVKDYKEFLIGTEFGKEHGARTLMKLLAFTKPVALKVIEQNPALARVPTKTIVKIFEILREAGIRKTTIIENPFLLAEVDGEFPKKIDIIQKIDIDINDAVHLFHLSLRTLNIYTIRSRIDASYMRESNRMRYLAGKLQCDLNTICKWLSYNPHILLTIAPKLMTTTEYFLECGVAPKHILSDPTAYKYSLPTIKEKIEKAKKLGVTPLKLWVLRGSEDAWKKCEAKYTRAKNALNLHENRCQALCQIFDCKPEDVEALAFKLAGFWNIKTDKLMKNAQLLRDAGYTIQEIQLSPRALHRKHETLREYLEIAKKYGCRSYLWLFSLSKSRFKVFIASEKYRIVT